MQPDALKSLMLTLVDDTQAVYAMTAAAGSRSGAPSDSVALVSANAARLQQKLSTVGLLSSITSLWSAEERGVLLMDEVDVLLHSLKSEVRRRSHACSMHF